MKYRNATLTILAITGGFMAASAQAAVITPVDWKQSNSFTNDRVADNLSNSTGMNGAFLTNSDGTGTGDVGTANGVSWVTSSKGNLSSAASAGRVWIIADLGASYDLTDLDIWNFNWLINGATNLTDRGVSQFDVYVRDSVADTTDGTLGGSAINLDNPNDDANNALDNDAVFNSGSSNPWTLALEDQALAQANATDTHAATNYDLTGNTGRFVAIVVDSYYGGNGIGLGKVQISAVPEPGSLALLGLGGLLIGARRRR